MTDLRKRAKQLGFHAMAKNWDEYANQAWVLKLIEEEEVEKGLRHRKLGRTEPAERRVAAMARAGVRVPDGADELVWQARDQPRPANANAAIDKCRRGIIALTGL